MKELTGNNFIADSLYHDPKDELTKCHNLLDSVFENSPMPTWISDEKGTLIRRNNACRKSPNITDDEVVGKYNLFKDNIIESKGFMPMVRDVFEKKITARFIIFYNTEALKGLKLKGAKNFLLDVSITPIVDAMGKVTNAIILQNDITEKRKIHTALKLSEEKFSNLIKNLNIGVLLQGPKAEILVSNPKALELLGITEEQLLGKTSFDSDWNVIHEDGSAFPSSTRAVPAAIASKKPVRDVVMGVHRPYTNDCTWLSVSAEPELNENGSVRQVICTLVDITERKKLKETLYQAERFSRSIVDALSSEISIIDETGLIIAVNKQWRIFAKANLQAPVNVSEGANYFTVCDATTGEEAVFAKAMIAGIRLVIKGKQNSFSLEYPCDSPTEKRWFNAVVTRFDDYLPLRIAIGHENITERKLIEIGLEITRKELALTKIFSDEVSEFAENIINTVREPLIAMDQDLRVIKASHSFYESFKVTPTETIGTLIYELGNNQWNIPKLRELLETILPEKTTFDNFEVTHNFSNIGERVMLLNARQIKRGLEKEKVILLAIEDITERKQSEKEVLRLNTELRELSKHLNNASEDERSAIAKEIHDEFAQNLVALNMNAAYLKSKIKDLTEKDIEIIEEQREIANGLINTSRALFNSLHPSMLDELGLEAAIGWYTKTKLKTSAIQFAVHTNISEQKLSKEISLGLFRIYQECLSNVILYSGATKLFVDIDKFGRTVNMKIQDNGVGFDKSKVDTKLHHGLLEMRERVFALNGKFTIKAVMGEGVLINVKVPI